VPREGRCCKVGGEEAYGGQERAAEVERMIEDITAGQ